jgi:formamidopyrimidine-DNA glycosylase
MVEGPQCRLAALRLRKTVTAQRLLKAVFLRERGNNGFNCEGAEVKEVFSVGKQIFIVFATAAIRIHLMMTGRIMLLDKDEEIPAAAQGAQMAAKLHFPKHTIVVFDHRFGETIRARVHMYSHGAMNAVRKNQFRDIVSSTFDSDTAVDLLRQNTEMVCVALMDQRILPGVGNKIKCEGLFRCGIHPRTTTRDLSGLKVRQLVQTLHEFALRWYDWDRNAADQSFSKTTPPTTPTTMKFDIYASGICPSWSSSCRGTTVLSRKFPDPGGRVSHYCPQCQKEGVLASEGFWGDGASASSAVDVSHDGGGQSGYESDLDWHRQRSKCTVDKQIATKPRNDSPCLQEEEGRSREGGKELTARKRGPTGEAGLMAFLEIIGPELKKRRSKGGSDGTSSRARLRRQAPAATPAPAPAPAPPQKIAQPPS